MRHQRDVRIVVERKESISEVGSDMSKFILLADGTAGNVIQFSDFYAWS